MFLGSVCGYLGGKCVRTAWTSWIRSEAQLDADSSRDETRLVDLTCPVEPFRFSNTAMNQTTLVIRDSFCVKSTLRDTWASLPQYASAVRLLLISKSGPSKLLLEAFCFTLSISHQVRLRQTCSVAALEHKTYLADSSVPVVPLHKNHSNQITFYLFYSTLQSSASTFVSTNSSSTSASPTAMRPPGPPAMRKAWKSLACTEIQPSSSAECSVVASLPCSV